MAAPGFLPNGSVDFNDPNIWDYSTGNLKPEYQAQAEADFNPGNAVPVDVPQPVLSPQQPPVTSGPILATPQQQGPVVPPPVLSEPFYPTPNGKLPPVSTGAPIVDKSVHTSQLPQVATAPQTSNRRSNTQLSVPSQKMTLAEKLGRYGGAIMNAGSQGGMAQVGAMGTVAGQIADKEREMERYAYEQQAQIEKEEKDRLAKQQQSQAKASEENVQLINDYDLAIAEMDRLYNDVLSHGDNLTGLFDGYAKAFTDTLGGDPRASTRLAMDQFKVDQILISVAKTKGAISDREMATFERPMPSMMADEKIWLDWINDKRNAAMSVRDKLKGMQSSNISASDQAIIDQYSNPQ